MYKVVVHGYISFHQNIWGGQMEIQDFFFLIFLKKKLKETKYKNKLI